jgi:lipooligosaccharide transport system permease protein
MNSSETLRYPSLSRRLYSVWYRHLRVYTRELFSNAFPPFLEPLIFLAGIGLGLGNYIATMDGVSYILFLATGLPMTASMWTASYECTFGTFIRLEFDKVYDGMLAASISARDLIVGEILWVGTKGFFFALSVILVVAAFRIVPMPVSLLVVFPGFLTGVMFGVISLFITSYVRTINHFNFYFTGLLSPMFFFCGIIFPVNQLPKVLIPIAELMPLTHTVRLSRAVCFWHFSPELLRDVLYCAMFIVIVGFLAVNRLTKRLID